MSKTLRHVAYYNTPHTRNVAVEDFERIGAADQTEDVSWNPGNGHEAEVSDSAADWLMKNEKGDWRIVKSSDGDASTSSENGGDDEETTDSSGEGNTPSKRRRTS